MSEIEYLLDLIKAHEFNEARLTAELEAVEEVNKAHIYQNARLLQRAEQAERERDLYKDWFTQAGNRISQLESRLARYEEGVEVTGIIEYSDEIGVICRPVDRELMRIGAGKTVTVNVRVRKEGE